MQVKNKVQLVTYPDSLGGNLSGLKTVLDEHYPGCFEGGLHILPPFPSSGDRGFAPLTYDEIDPRFGSWEDVRALGESHDLMLDLIVNHVSSRSPYFRDFLAKGRKSAWADLFITLDKIWPDGAPIQADLDRIFLRRPQPWSIFPVGTPAANLPVWTTFGKTDPSEQIDMDWRSAQFRSVVEGLFARFSRGGVRIVRLDAVGYLAKRAGTSCFCVQPETDEILAWLDALARRYDMVILPEVHAPESIQAGIAALGYWTYDFILPYRVLEALILRTPLRLAAYLAARPARQFTMLDCHDGVPVKPDLDGLYNSEDVRQVVNTCLARGANMSRILSPQHQDGDGFDVHQIRGTFYSLLDCDDDAYIAARAIQLFAPGVPQVYYVGLLAGENDQEAVARTGDGREANRRNFSREEVQAARQRSVVQRLERLIRLRNAHASFNGSFRVSAAAEGRLRMSWAAGGETCALEVDFRTQRAQVEQTREGGMREVFDL